MNMCECMYGYISYNNIKGHKYIFFLNCIALFASLPLWH